MDKFLLLSPVIDVVVFLAITLSLVAFVIAWKNRQSYWSEIDSLFQSHGFVSTTDVDKKSIEPPHLISGRRPEFGTDVHLKLIHIYRQTQTETLGLQYEVTLNYGNSSIHVPVSVLIQRMSTSLPGWVQLKSEKSLLKDSQKELLLESNQFNRAVDVRAEPQQLGPLVFPPDVMQWYLNQNHRSWIHVEGNVCCVAFEGKLSGTQFDRLQIQLAELKKFVERSGALDPVRDRVSNGAGKKSKPLFPR